MLPRGPGGNARHRGFDVANARRSEPDGRSASSCIFEGDITTRSWMEEDDDLLRRAEVLAPSGTNKVR